MIIIIILEKIIIIKKILMKMKKKSKIIIQIIFLLKNLKIITIKILVEVILIIIEIIKKNSYGGSTISQDNNTIKNEKEENIEDNGESPEILYEEFFNYFLPSKKHTLNIKECKNAMRCLGLVVTEREIQEFLGIKEKTGKEKINLEEFKSVCDKKFNESNNNLVELKEAFEMLDPERTGIVDSKVLRHQMKVFKPKMTEEEVNQILSEFGEDKNGNINYREYLRNIKG